jgi:hypothetical protein
MSGTNAARATLLEQLAQACRAGRADAQSARAVQPSGFAELDAVLPGGGWPLGAVTELMPESIGIGELSLVMPALAYLTRAERYLAWIAPPYLPYPPALIQQGIQLERLLIIQARDEADALWAAEQALRCPSFGAVLAWPAAIDERRVRRLQLAAETGGSCALLYRPESDARRPSPAALRLKLKAAGRGTRVEIHKARGGRAHDLVVHPTAPTGP